MERTVITLEDADAVAAHLCGILTQALQAGGRAVLAGGTSALKAYQMWGQQDILWSRVQLVVSDERCVAPQHPDRNETVIKKAIGREKVAFVEFPAEGNPTSWCEAMESSIAALLPFDIVVLGLGEDAHTASLFPGDDLSTEALLTPIYSSPKPPAERATLSAKALSSTPLMVLVVTGAGKQQALAKVLSGQDVPPNHLNPQHLIVLCDQAANPS